MTREEAFKLVSELSCSRRHMRMTDCSHCAKEAEPIIKALMDRERVAPREERGEVSRGR